MSELIQIHEPEISEGQVRPSKTRVRKREPGPRPDWLTVRYRRNERFSQVETVTSGLNLVTVCEEARCPNIDECWSAGTATFMLMGEICTRRCGFCAVGKGTPQALDPEEPENTARAIEALGVRHAVITSVNRDELADGGAGHFAATVEAIAARSPETRIELLIPDLLGQREPLDRILDSGPHIVAHNTETIARLYRRVRPQAIYERSLEVLRVIAAHPDAISKTGVMLGLGETDAEVVELMQDLREVGCEILTLGQYLSPTTRHLPVERWVHPESFEMLREMGYQLGFTHVESGPLVRSSYMAHRPFTAETPGLEV